MTEEIVTALNDAYRYVDYALSWLRGSDRDIALNKRKIVDSLEKAEKRISEIQEFYKV